MNHGRNILITGGSGYLGGSLLAELKKTDIPALGTVYALVRSEGQAQKVREHFNATPLILDLEDQEAITAILLEKRISAVFYLIHAASAENQKRFIKALKEVKAQLGVETHLLHTTGAKAFSGFTRHPTDRVLSDADDGLYGMQKNASSAWPMFEMAVDANNDVIEAGEQHGVKTYVYIPCIVYGEGSGFGNRISIQTVAIVRAAKGMRRMCKVDHLEGSWPVSHVHDSVTLYIALLRKMLDGDEIDHGRNGYYLAASGSIAWADLYKQMAKGMAKRGVIEDDTVHEASDEALEEAAKALGSSKDWVPVEMGGVCSLQADRGRKIGWAPEYPAEHILDDAENEVELILKNL